MKITDLSPIKPRPRWRAKELAHLSDRSAGQWNPNYGTLEGDCNNENCCWSDLQEARDWVFLHAIATDEQVERGGYVWWYYSPTPSRFRLEKWLMCPEHSNHLLLLWLNAEGLDYDN